MLLTPGFYDPFTALMAEQAGFEAAMEHAEAYLACARFAGRIPLRANMVEGDKGFRIAIFPGGTASAVAFNLQKYDASLHAHQTTAPMQDQMLDFDQLNEVIGTP